MLATYWLKKRHEPVMNMYLDVGSLVSHDSDIAPTY